MARRRKQPGTGCVNARPSKKQGTVYAIRWRINNGPARNETIGPDRAEAEQALALRLAEVNRGAYRERRKATFHEFASEWFTGHRARLRPSASDRVRNDLEMHLVPFFGEYYLDQISADLVEAYVAEKLTERRRGDARVARLDYEFDDLIAKRRGEPSSVRRELAQARRERGSAACRSTRRSRCSVRCWLQPFDTATSTATQSSM
jgi:Phage integrase, N-terminal SAM-like domain